MVTMLEESAPWWVHMHANRTYSRIIYSRIASWIPTVRSRRILSSTMLNPPYSSIHNLELSPMLYLDHQLHCIIPSRPALTVLVPDIDTVRMFFGTSRHSSQPTDLFDYSDDTASCPHTCRTVVLQMFSLCLRSLVQVQRSQQLEQWWAGSVYHSLCGTTIAKTTMNASLLWLWTWLYKNVRINDEIGMFFHIKYFVIWYH